MSEPQCGRSGALVAAPGTGSSNDATCARRCPGGACATLRSRLRGDYSGLSNPVQARPRYAAAGCDGRMPRGGSAASKPSHPRPTRRPIGGSVPTTRLLRSQNAHHARTARSVGPAAPNCDSWSGRLSGGLVHNRSYSTGPSAVRHRRGTRNPYHWPYRPPARRTTQCRRCVARSGHASLLARAARIDSPV